MLFSDTDTVNGLLINLGCVSGDESIIVETDTMVADHFVEP